MTTLFNVKGTKVMKQQDAIRQSEQRENLHVQTAQVAEAARLHEAPVFDDLSLGETTSESLKGGNFNQRIKVYVCPSD